MMPAKKPARRKPARRVAVTAPPVAVDLTLLIGQMVGTVNSLKETVEADREQWAAERADAATYRQGIRETLDKISGTVAAICGPDGQRINNLEKAAGDFKQFRNRLAGGVMVLTVFWGLALAVITDKVKKVFS